MSTESSSSSSSSSSSDAGRSVAAVAAAARRASRVMQATTHDTRLAVLRGVCSSLRARRDEILAANVRDVEAAQGNPSLSSALVRRLVLNEGKFDALVAGTETLLAAADPLASVSMARELADGLRLYRCACPIGVLLIIFEARPEAAVQIATLAVKSGNAVILKGGKEAEASNAALVECVRSALRDAGAPEDAVQLVATRNEVAELLRCDTDVDLVIPRGSNALVRYITANTRIPVMGHSDGICSVYVDAAAARDVACRVVVDSKCQYPAACNAAETLLVHASRVEDGTLRALGDALAAAGVSLFACERSLPHLPPAPTTQPATPEHYDTEFLDLRMAVRVVDSLDDAVAHIAAHGSCHTECIVTTDAVAAERFMREVDAAGVYHNTSTRFADGFRYGFGAEVGVSTNRTHARGPVGVEGLLIYKYRAYGDGHIVAEFADGSRSFTHRDLDDRTLPTLTTPTTTAAAAAAASDATTTTKQ